MEHFDKDPTVVNFRKGTVVILGKSLFFKEFCRDLPT